MDIRRIFNRLGPGGLKCPCCGPAPRHRKAFFRMVKKRERVWVGRVVEEQIAAML